MASIVAPVRVEIFSDVVCPWCYIGKARFQAAMHRLGDPTIEVVYHPFQLDPSAPTGSPSPVVEAYAKKFGGPERAQAILDHVTAIAADDGLHFAMDRALRANTRLAHRLLLAAELPEDPQQQSALYERLFSAYFCEGLDIGDHDTLVRLAAESGMEPTLAHAALTDSRYDDQLTARLDQAASLGVTAVPTFVIDRQWQIPGAQDVEFFERTIRRLLDQS